MQHMQQQRLTSWLQQLEAALTNSSVGSDDFAFSAPGGIFFAVAIKLPKPTPSFPKNMIFWPSKSTFFCSFSMLYTCFSGILRKSVIVHVHHIITLGYMFQSYTDYSTESQYKLISEVIHLNCFLLSKNMNDIPNFSKIISSCYCGSIRNLTC